LRVDDRDGWLCLSSFFFANLFPQEIVNPLPGSVESPAIKDLIDRLPGRKASGQHSPLAAGSVEVQDGVDDVPPGVGEPASALGLLAEQRFENLPLCVSEIRGRLPLRHEYRSFLGIGVLKKV